MELLLVAPELSPLRKEGGVADGVAALAKALHRFGHRVTVALPWNEPEVPPGFVPDPELVVLSGALVEPLFGRAEAGFTVMLLRVAPDGHGIWGDDRDLTNARRFAVFARAVTAVVDRRARRGEPFDVVHVHEWPAAPVPYLLRERGGPRPRTVLTLHNLAFQGAFPEDALALLGLGPEHFHPSRLELYGKVNYLKAGIVAADALTTVSPTYAREILLPEHGEQLEGVLRTRARDLVGITNGIDADVYNPATDPALPARYGADDPTGKARCKEVLALAQGSSSARPLVLSLGRVVEQKGSDLLAEALPAILAAGADVVIAGAGEPHLEQALTAAAARASSRAAYLGRVSEALARQLLAAADLVVMPSRYEPCGIVQLQAQRYGAVPVARRTGGLADTIVDLSPDLTDGSGFLFQEATAEALASAVRRALEAMRLPGWDALRRRVMRLAPSWNAAARRYEAVYRGVFAMQTRPSGN